MKRKDFVALFFALVAAPVFFVTYHTSQLWAEDSSTSSSGGTTYTTTSSGTYTSPSGTTGTTQTTYTTTNTSGTAGTYTTPPPTTTHVAPSTTYVAPTTNTTYTYPTYPSDSSLTTSSTETVRTITESFNKIEEDTTQVKETLSQELSGTLTASSTSTFNKAEYERYLLQKQQNLLRAVDTSLTPKNLEIAPATSLKQTVDTTLAEIERERQIDVSEKRQRLQEVVSEAETTFIRNREELQQRNGLEVYNDTDDDGVSDFDERHIFGTDPQNPSTTGGLSDGEKIAAGFNPLSTSTEPEKIVYESPEQSQNVLEKGLSVTGIEVVEKEVIQDKEVAKKIAFTGKALPNAYVTLYIYSTPVIVTVKTNNDGEWQYTLDKELEDGSHTVYVAMVNNTGKIVARSQAIPFVKQAAAVEFEPGLATGKVSQGFFNKYFVVLSLAILLLVLVVAIIVSGMHKPVAPTDTEPHV